MWYTSRGSSELWNDIGAAQSRFNSAGNHDITLRLTDSEKVRFFIDLKSEPLSYELRPIDLPTRFDDPIPMTRLASLVEQGLPDGLLFRLAIKSLAIVLPDLPLETLRLSNMISNEPPSQQFLYGCQLLDLVHKSDLLRVETSNDFGFHLDPKLCGSYGEMCEALEIRRQPIKESLSEPNLRNALVRVALYELLRQADSQRHPAFRGLTETKVKSIDARSRFEIVGALIAEKWIFEQMNSDDPKRKTHQCVHDGDGPKSSRVVAVANALLDIH